ncbi:MAG TPA: protein kinase [Gemmatimonadales bacterium]|nr:protein kinase [Gemmatimonadales bacterium]
MTDPRAHLTAALAAHYRIDRELGAGGMATVYLAHDLKHDRPVALKVLRPELAAILGGERFLKEIRLTANLQHPHILGLHDSGEADGVIYYVMPYVEGESLRERMNRERQLPIEDAVRITTEVAGALDYAHRHGVVHRDIKPENILLHDGAALVADFGIALAASSAGGGTRLTETGMSLGTPHYMAPEQAMGEREITGRADVYALGCVLYEMLTGEPPFTGATAQAIVARVLTEEPRSITLQRRTVPPHVEDAVFTALEKLPADRFSSAAQFAEALHRPGATVPVTRARSVAMKAPALPANRATWIAAGLAVLGLGAGIWGWLAARAAGRQPASWHYVQLSDSVPLYVAAPSFAVSPDGSTIVFKSGVPDFLLWVKRPGDLHATVIQGTARAQNPVFSPDGKWIAFVADGHLKKAQLLGGAPVTLADSVAGGFGGVAWLDDNTLVYVASNLTELRRVEAAGGPSTVVLHDTTLTGGGIGEPVALPGARGVLFQYCGSQCVTMGMHVLDLRTGKQTLLLSNVAGAWYLPDGHLLYVQRDGAGFAAPFDLSHLRMTGSAIPVLQAVTLSQGAGPPLLDISRSGTLVYVSGTSSRNDVEVARVARTGAVSLLDTTWHGEFNSLALSPDGRQLALGVGVGGALNIWVRSVARGPATRLSFGNADRRPEWSPDGRAVAFIRDSTGSSAFSSSGAGNAVYARPADGSGSDRLLARLSRPVQEVDWSHDGRWLILRTDNGAGGAGDVVGVQPGRDSTPVDLVATPFTELQPALSRDGHWLAYTSNESGNLEVYVRPFPNTNGGRWQVSNGGGIEPRWSADGREIYYLDPSPRMMAARVALGPTFAVTQTTSLFTVSPSLFILDQFHQAYDVSPDGSTFYFLIGRGGEHTPEVVWVDHWFSDLKGKLGR